MGYPWVSISGTVNKNQFLDPLRTNNGPKSNKSTLHHQSAKCTQHCSCFSTEKLCYSATLSAAERRHPKDDVQISDVHAVDSKHMQSIETTLFKLNLWQIQSGVKHYFTNSTYVNKHVLKSTCYFQPTWACDCHHARESKPTPTPPFWRLFLSACKFGASVDGFFGQNLLGWMQSSTGYLFTKKHGHKHTIFWRQRIWSLWIFDWIFYTTASVLTPHSIRGVELFCNQI